MSTPLAWATTTGIQSNICTDFATPTIIEPASGIETKDASILVTGTGEPDMSVVIINNGSEGGNATVAPDGSYGLEVPLAVGDNTLIARTQNNCTNKDSPNVMVHRLDTAQPSNPPIPVSPTSPQPPFSTQSAPDTTSLPPAIGELPPLNQSLTPIPDTPGFQKPTIVRPQHGQEVDTSRIWVEGTAPPGSIVTIYVNGLSAARTIASETGHYAAAVVLIKGENTIQTRAELKGNVATSDLVKVYFIPEEPSSATRQPIWPIYALIGLSIVLLVFLLVSIYNKYTRKKSKQ